MKTKSYPPTPELDKMLACKEQSQVQGALLEWLSEQGIQLAKQHEHSDACRNESKYNNCGLREGDLIPVYDSIEKILARYHEIDLSKCEKERRAILDHINA